MKYMGNSVRAACIWKNKSDEMSTQPAPSNAMRGDSQTSGAWCAVD